jgi:hypothetical protein
MHLALAGMAATALILAGCGSAQFDTKLAPGFTAAHHTVSVLGVYKDGQMSSEAWGNISGRMASWLGTSQCPVGYASAATEHDGALLAAIDDYARANGPTEELLNQLAPAAKGDLILTVTIAGRPPTPEKVSVVNDSNSNGQGGAGGGGMGAGGGHGGGASGPKHGPATDTNVLDMVASLFSVSEHRSVAQVSMRYSGETVDDALTRFAQRLAVTLPGATCSGWNWSAQVDPDRIRRSAD